MKAEQRHGETVWEVREVQLVALAVSDRFADRVDYFDIPALGTLAQV